MLFINIRLWWKGADYFKRLIQLNENNFNMKKYAQVLPHQNINIYVVPSVPKKYIYHYYNHVV